MAGKAEKQAEAVLEEMDDSEAFLDDFSDLELSGVQTKEESLDSIETMLIDINVEPYAEKKTVLSGAAAAGGSSSTAVKADLVPKKELALFPETAPKRKININQKSSGVVAISPKQFKEEVKGPEDKLEVAVNKIKVVEKIPEPEKVTIVKPVEAEKTEVAEKSRALASEKPEKPDPDRERRFQELRDMLARMNREEAMENEWQEEKKEEPEKEEKPAKEEPKEEKPTQKLRAVIKVDAFGSPAHRAKELEKKITEELPKNLTKIIKSGIIRLLQSSCVDFGREILIRAGLLSTYENDFFAIYDFKDKNIKESLEAESKLKEQALNNLVAKNAAKVSDEDFSKNVREGILNAIMLGGHEDALSGKIVYALPVEEDAALKNLMFENKIKLDAPSTVRASFAGFISLLELEKGNEEISAKTLEVLDWYFENFHYRKYYEDFVKTMNFYIDINDFDFERAALSYAYHRQNKNEQLIFKEIENGDDTETIQRLAGAKKISHETMRKILEDYKFKNDFHKQFLEIDRAEVKGKAFKKLKEIYNFEAGTYAKAVKEIKRIREIDNFASFFEGEARADFGGRPAVKYLLVRFGFNGYNNVVVLKLQDGVQPILAWRGKTGEDSDGFREYFKKAENEIKRHKMMKILDGKFNHEILNSEMKWQKVWDFLNWPD